MNEVMLDVMFHFRRKTANEEYADSTKSPSFTFVY